MKKYIVKDNSEYEIKDSILTATADEVGRIETPFDKKILSFFWFFILITLAILMARVFFLTVIKGDYYHQIAEGNNVKLLPIKVTRGKIYDRKMEVLASSVPSFDLVLYSSFFPKDDNERKEIIKKLFELFPQRKKEIEDNLYENIDKTEYFIIAKNISREESLIFSEKKKEFFGIEMQKTAVRNYPDGLIFSHILGYEGQIRKKELAENPDYLLNSSIGKSGLEKSYEKYLRGQYGARKVEVDSLGRIKREIGIDKARAGSDLVLNIDAGLQKKIFDTLSDALDKNELKRGAVIAIDPRTGGVLALVSVPSFDNNLFAQGISAKDYSELINNPDKPMFNRVIAGEYPPGSTIKPLLAIGALEEGVISEQTQIESRGGIKVGNWFFGDWKTHGFTDVREAIAVSSDVFFYSIGGGYGSIKGMGIEKIGEYEKKFGWGKKTGIDIRGEKDGFIPTPEWKLEKIGEKWYKGNTYHASIGQGYVKTTPLQVANYIVAIANGGTLYQPQIVSQIINGSDVVIKKPTIIQSSLVDTSILKIVQEGMRMTVASGKGTARMLNELKIEVAGKTGTAQYGSEEKTYGWFASYAPYKNPEIVLVVLVEGQDKKHNYNAVPITKEVYEYYFAGEEAMIDNQ